MQTFWQTRTIIQILLLFTCFSKIDSIFLFIYPQLLQESIPEKCLLPTCQLHMLRWPPDVTTDGLVGVSSSDQVWRGLQSWPPDLTSSWGGVGGCTVRFNASWVMVTWGLPPARWTVRLTDGHVWKHYLSGTPLASGKSVTSRSGPVITERLI